MVSKTPDERRQILKERLDQQETLRRRRAMQKFRRRISADFKRIPVPLKKFFGSIETPIEMVSRAIENQNDNITRVNETVNSASLPDRQGQTAGKLCSNETRDLIPLPVDETGNDTNFRVAESRSSCPDEAFSNELAWQTVENLEENDPSISEPRVEAVLCTKPVLPEHDKGEEEKMVAEDLNKNNMSAYDAASVAPKHDDEAEKSSNTEVPAKLTQRDEEILNIVNSYMKTSPSASSASLVPDVEHFMEITVFDLINDTPNSQSNLRPPLIIITPPSPVLDTAKIDSLVQAPKIVEVNEEKQVTPTQIQWEAEDLPEFVDIVWDHRRQKAVTLKRRKNLASKPNPSVPSKSILSENPIDPKDTATLAIDSLPSKNLSDYSKIVEEANFSSIERYIVSGKDFDEDSDQDLAVILGSMRSRKSSFKPDRKRKASPFRFAYNTGPDHEDLTFQPLDSEDSFSRSNEKRLGVNEGIDLYGAFQNPQSGIQAETDSEHGPTQDLLTISFGAMSPASKEKPVIVAEESKFELDESLTTALTTDNAAVQEDLFPPIVPPINPRTPELKTQEPLSEFFPSMEPPIEPQTPDMVSIALVEQSSLLGEDEVCPNNDVPTRRLIGVLYKKNSHGYFQSRLVTFDGEKLILFTSTLNRHGWRRFSASMPHRTLFLIHPHLRKLLHLAEACTFENWNTYVREIVHKGHLSVKYSIPLASITFAGPWVDQRTQSLVDERCFVVRTVDQEFTFRALDSKTSLCWQEALCAKTKEETENFQCATIWIPLEPRNINAIAQKYYVKKIENMIQIQDKDQNGVVIGKNEFEHMKREPKTQTFN